VDKLVVYEQYKTYLHSATQYLEAPLFQLRLLLLEIKTRGKVLGCGRLCTSVPNLDVALLTVLDI
jgi:hypothetical protein